MERQRWEESERRSQEVRRAEKRKSDKKEDAGARKGRKVAIHRLFPMIWGSGWSKSNLAKAAGAEPAGQMRDEKLHAAVARSTFPRSTFGSCDVEKVQAVVARSTFPSQNAQKTQHSRTFGRWDAEKARAVLERSTFPSQKCKKLKVSEHFWKRWKCTRLWREAHCQVKSQNTQKTQHSRTLERWDAEKVHAVVARSTFPTQKCKKLTGLDHFLTFRCLKSGGGCGAKHISKSKCTKRHMYGPLLTLEMWFCVAGARDCAPC